MIYTHFRLRTKVGVLLRLGLFLRLLRIICVHTKNEGHSQGVGCAPQKGHPYFNRLSKACQILEAVFENIFLFGKEQQYFSWLALIQMAH